MVRRMLRKAHLNRLAQLGHLRCTVEEVEGDLPGELQGVECSGEFGEAAVVQGLQDRQFVLVPHATLPLE